MMSLESNTTARKLAKAVTPPIANFAAAARFSSSLDLLTTYLSLLTGKGSGSGWDDGELLVASRALQAIAEPVVVDCGANMGTWTGGVRSRLGHHRGRWLLVEPVPDYAERLRRLDNVTVIEAAAGEAASVMPLYVPNRASGWMSLHPRGDSFAHGEDFTTLKVQVLKLDDVFRSNDVEHVDFLKMDLEGHELFALRGAGDYLAQGKIAALAFEFGSANVNSRTFFRDFWELLTPLGYTLYRMVPGGRTLKISHYDETLEFFRGATNYLAVRG